MIGSETQISIGFAVLVFGGFLALWWRIEAKFATAAAERLAVEREIAAYKLHVAETYMSKSSGGLAIDRAVTEIKGLRVDLKDEMTKLGGRIERMETLALEERRRIAS